MNRCTFRERGGALLLAFVAGGCQVSNGTPESAVTHPRRAAKSDIRFVRVTDPAGVRFQHTDGSSGRKYFPEVMGGGCAFVDLTSDGRPDIYLVNGVPLPGTPSTSATGNRFYANNGDGTFTDQTDAAGLRDGRYGIGCCAGDFDNDGFMDLYVTHLGRNTLYRARAPGVFEDVTARAGVGAGGFSAGAAFADYDNDGDLDLYVCRYVAWTPEQDVSCFASDGSQRVKVYCRPSVYPPSRDILYRNNGDGTFTNVLGPAGMDGTPGRGLGCVWTDIDRDGDQDLFVANDMTSNFLFVNQGNGRFVEDAMARGVAVGEDGRPQASMGVASVDFDGDGQLDLACTNFSGEYLALYRNGGKGQFRDVSAQSGLVEATSRYVGFGMAFPDLNGDGFPDLLVANGHVTEGAERFYPGVTFAQPTLSFQSDRKGSFRLVPDASADLTRPRVSRGLACADFNGDGRPDLLVTNLRGEPDLLRNESPDTGRWLRLSLVGRKANRSGIGALVSVSTGSRTQVQEVRSGGSYCSQGELTLTFGLGDASIAKEVTVSWPGGDTQTWSSLPGKQMHVLRQH